MVDTPHDGRNPYLCAMAVPGVAALKRSAYLTADDNEPRARRSADVTTVCIGLIFVLWGCYAFGKSDPLQETLSQFAQALPEWAVALLALSYTLGLILALVLVVAFIYRRRWSAVRDVAIAGIGASITTIVIVAISDELWPPFFNEFLQGAARPQFPIVRVALVAAVLVAATPYVARPIRRIGWTVVVLISIAAVALALSVPSGAVTALGIGMIFGSGVLLLFGSPAGYPDAEAVKEAIAGIGIDVPDLRIAHDQSWGVRRLVGTTTDGVPVEVKAYGRDATDSQLMAKLWRTAMYRGSSERLTASRIQSVEHEAVVTMMAEKAGVAVPSVLAAASANDEVAVLVTTRGGNVLSELESPEAIDQAQLIDLWRQIKTMHSAGITHGAPTLGTIRLTDEGFTIGEFGNGSVVYKQSEACLDVVHLLFATAALLGPERAVEAAVEGLGKEKLSECLGYLQPPALTQRERRSVKGSSKLLKTLREQVSAATDVEPPDPVKLRRISRKGILTLVLVFMFASALIPLLTGVDYAAMWASLESAIWWLAVLSVLMGQLAFIPQGTSMMCAVGRPIPLRPMTILQPAVAFISFAVPGMAGRVAMESAFLYKYGIAPAVSVTKGALDSFSGFIVQAVILVVAFLTGALTLPQSTSTSSSSSSSGSWLLIILVVLLAVATVVVVLRVKKIHDRVVPEIKNAWEALLEVFRSPKLAFGLLGSQLVVQLIWGLALWIALLSMGVHLSLISCTAVVVATSLLQGIIPVPGGIGVSEAVMSAFLVPLGVPSEIALGATIIWRVATFYLPAIEGFFASRYLSKRGYL